MEKRTSLSVSPAKVGNISVPPPSRPVFLRRRGEFVPHIPAFAYPCLRARAQARVSTGRNMPQNSAGNLTELPAVSFYCRIFANGFIAESATL